VLAEDTVLVVHAKIRQTPARSLGTGAICRKCCLNDRGASTPYVPPPGWGSAKPFSGPVSQKVQVSQLSSFTRTIPRDKKEDDVNQILSRKNDFIPLAYKPTKAQAGDFIYLVFRGIIVGRARISSIDAVDNDVPSGIKRYPDWARWVVRYAGEWERPPREIQVQGHQSVRYLETHSLTHLDSEKW
jgi:hypothetical protein